ncbi:MAG TPA: phosphodiester glycosidase family protein [Chthonomonadales bacterium]|nr:phosphodiester glycosidase family protein [Chthonomonadales bacterium]
MARHRTLLTLWLLAFTAVPAMAQLDWRPIARGVEHLQESIAIPTGRLLVNALRVDLRADGVRVRSALGRDVVITDEPAKGRETVHELCNRLGALAAVNADYFPFTGDPLGMAIQHGAMVSEPMANRVALGVTATGQVRFDTLLSVGVLRASDGAERALDGVNRIPNDGEVCVLKPVFGSRIRATSAHWTAVLGGTPPHIQPGRLLTGRVESTGPGTPQAPIPPSGLVLVGLGRGADWLRERLVVGSEVSFRFDLVSNSAPDGRPRGDFASRAGSLRGRLDRSVWDDVTEAVSGGPWLLRQGATLVDGREQGFDEATFTLRTHPRTAAGVTPDGRLLLVTVDGRQRHSRGMSLAELAATMKRLGATDAINLDGGGSTTMVARGLVLNAPSDGSPRPVANALVVFADPLDPTAPVADIEAEPLQAAAGDPVACAIPGSEGPALWGTVEGRGLVDQAGVFRSVRAGVHTVVSIAGSIRTRRLVTVLPGAPAHLRATLGAAPNDPWDRNTVRLTVIDRHGNGVPGVSVALMARGGSTDRSSVTTDAAGAATAEVVWDFETDRVLTASVPGLTSVTVRSSANSNR